MRGILSLSAALLACLGCRDGVAPPPAPPPVVDRIDLEPGFCFEGEPVHPGVIDEFSGWLSDGPMISGIYLDGAYNSDRYFHYKVERWGNWVYGVFDAGNAQEGFLRYLHHGRTPGGIHVIEAHQNGGGSGVFQDLIFLRFEHEVVLENGRVRARPLLRRVGGFILGDRDSGTVRLSGSTVFIGPSHHRREPVEIDLSQFDSETSTEEQDVKEKYWAGIRERLRIFPESQKFQKIGWLLWRHMHPPGSDTERAVTWIRIWPVEGIDKVYAAACDWEPEWWGIWVCFKVEDGRIHWVHGGGQDEQSVREIRSIRVPGREGPVIQVIGTTHMGHGDLYFYELVGERLVYRGETFGYDSHKDDTLIEGGALAVNVEDFNLDGHRDLVLTGTVEIYDGWKEESPIRRVPVRKVLIWNQDSAEWIQDKSLRLGWDVYPSRE